MPHSDHIDDLKGVVDRIQHSVVADPDPPKVVRTSELDIDAVLDPRLMPQSERVFVTERFGKRFKFLSSRPREKNHVLIH
jgi:hypothetical protein